jgi:serine/threonine protein kinase
MHRDIKPENILLRPGDQKWVLVDFGLAAFTNEKYLFDRCGTLGYMAPEVFTLNEEEKDAQATYNSACDVYSLGVISFQLVFGTLPFKFESEGGSEKKVVWYGFKKAECS